MINLINSLESRYKAVLQSGLDSVFYKNVHIYIDFIEKTPKLSFLINKSEDDYSSKHERIWKGGSGSNTEIDLKNEETLHLEKFNLFASDYSLLFTRIYSPIERYKELKEVNNFKALIMLRGKDHFKVDKKDQEIKDLFNKWYEGQRGFYEEKLKQFHFEFISEIEKLENKPASDFEFNENTGDFHFKNKHITFTPNTQEYKVFKTLLNSPDYKSDYLSLIQSIHFNVLEATKSKKGDMHIIIRRINKKLGSSVVKNIPNVGYRLIFKDDKE